MKSTTISTLFLATGLATAQTCGTSGYDNSGHDTASAPAYKLDTTATTPQSCSALCKSDNTCQSFAVGNEICLLYAAPTANNFTPYDYSSFSATRSPYYFYDAACAITSASPPLPFSSPICGVQGYDRGNPGSGYIENGGTQKLCSAECKSRPDCKAYAIIDNFVTHRQTGCFYYTNLVDNFVANSIDDPRVGSSFYFYERDCPTRNYDPQCTLGDACA
ncbi:hypothetical protein Q7P35_004546 [Cladosporium inversicolor]